MVLFRVNFSKVFFNFIKLILVYVLTFLQPLVFFNSGSVVYAEGLSLVVDGTTNSNVTTAANGVPIVNIASPNDGGLSYNRFRDYNVNESGLIINNATGGDKGVTNSNLAGLILDNPNLVNSGSASVILNEVTSNNKSYLNGYTEIAGDNADLIIANPNGIAINGAGFINVAKLTTIVGNSNYQDSNLDDLTFNLAGDNYIDGAGFLPKLTISGLGLDLEEVAQTNIIANAMEIVAPIYGGDNIVNIKSANSNFNYNRQEVSSSDMGDNLESVSSDTHDQIAIDASNLSNIQAGQIYMVATQEGFAVKYDGDMLASRNGITIEANGDISYNNILSESGSITISSNNGDIVNQGVTASLDNQIKLTSSNDINIAAKGQLLAASNINITSNNDFNNESSNINLSENDFIINSNNNINNSGTLSAYNDLTINSNSNINNSGDLVANNNLELTSEEITNSNLIVAANQLNITANSHLTNEADILSLADNLTINTDTLNNKQQIASNEIININANIINNNNSNSQITSDNNINLNISSLLDNNQGIIDSSKSLTINNSNQSDTIISNNNGNIQAINSININLGNNSDYNIDGTLKTRECCTKR